MAYSSTQGAASSYNRSVKRAGALSSARKDAIEVTLELIHPSHLGALPPAPKTILRKAHQRGLLTSSEYYGF